MADTKRKIEIFSADCPLCRDVIVEVNAAACSSCEVETLDMTSDDVQARTNDLGIKSVPAVVIDGKLADCCATRGVDLDILRAAGLGKRI